MNKPLIKIAYRQVIDITAASGFEKDVFEDSYIEFLLQAQAYNPENKFSSFEELKSNNPKANSLHYKVGFSVGLYIRSLQNKIRIPQETGVAIELPFEVSEFEIIQSSITDKKQHKVAITYTTGACTLLQVIGEYLLLSFGDQNNNEEWQETFLVKPGKTISIVGYQEKNIPLVVVNE